MWEEEAQLGSRSRSSVQSTREMSVFEPPGERKQTKMVRFHALTRVFEVFKKIRFNLSVRVFDFCIFYHSLSSGLIAGGNA